MAKKKQVEFDVDTTDSFSSLAGKLQTAFKKNPNINIVQNYLTEDPILGAVSTGSFFVDAAIGHPKLSGFPVPAIVEIVGTESCGKSVLAFSAMGNIQKLGGKAVLIDAESSFTHEYAAMAKLDVSPSQFLYLNIGIIEDVFEVIRVIITDHFTNAPGVPLAITLDSVAGTSTRSEQESMCKGDEPARAMHARILSRELRTISNMIHGKPCLLMFTNQLKSAMPKSPWDAQYTSFGGMALKYHSRVRIEITRAGLCTDSKTGVVFGLKARVKVIKNKIAAPNRVGEMEIHYGAGIEDYLPIIDWMTDKGVIPLAGKMLMWKNKKYWASQLREHFIEVPEDWTEAKGLFMEAYAAHDNREPIIPARREPEE